MNFMPERLTGLRESMGMNKAEAARKLNMSAMGYGRYEKGEREPSYQTVCYIAQTFGTTVDYLYGINDQISPTVITINSADDPELFSLIQAYKTDPDTASRLLAYLKKINK